MVPHRGQPPGLPLPSGDGYQDRFRDAGNMTALAEHWTLVDEFPLQQCRKIMQDITPFLPPRPAGMETLLATFNLHGGNHDIIN